MKRADRVKLSFTRNWNLPGTERLSRWIKPSDEIKITLKNGITWLKNEDIAIYTTADNFIEYAILSTGTYENEISKLINISLKPGFVALDIGGNIGIQSIRMSKCVGLGGKVYSFEPLNYLQAKFKKNIALNRCENITLFPLALSDTDGELTVNIDEHNWNQGTFNLQQPDSGSVPQKIAVKAGDGLNEVQSLERIDLIKIDVEGFEFQVLRGLKEALKKHQPRIIFEYDHHHWRDTAQSIADCFAFLTSLNYSVFQILVVGAELITCHSDIETGNLFCIPAEVKV